MNDKPDMIRIRQAFLVVVCFILPWLCVIAVALH